MTSLMGSFKLEGGALGGNLINIFGSYYPYQREPRTPQFGDDKELQVVALLPGFRGALSSTKESKCLEEPHQCHPRPTSE